MSVLLGNGDGTFRPQKTYATGTNPDSVRVSDLNADGRLDVVVANMSSNSVGVLLGNGDGTLQAQQSLGVPGGATSVVVADFNADGKLDLATCASSVSVLLGNGDGTFQSSRTVSVSGYALEVVDLNGDAKPDLVVANPDTGKIVALLGRGDGTFQNAGSFAAGGGCYFLAVSDVNNDTHPDVVVTNYTTANTASVLLGNGDGTFQSPRAFAVGAQPGRLALADLNLDGNADIVAVNNSSNDISLLLGNGDGTFQNQQRFAAGYFPHGVTVADLDADGVQDVLVADYSGNAVSVLLATFGTLSAALDPASDTGSSSGDHLTFDTQPVVLATVNMAGTLAVDADADGRPETERVVDAAGTYSLKLPALRDGSYRLAIVFAPTLGHILTSTVPVTIDSTGPRLSSWALVRNSSNPMSCVVGFDAAIDPATFTPADATLQLPDGTSISPATIAALSDSTFRLEFPPQEDPGVYFLSIGPDIRDLAGNPMDQDRNGINGQAADLWQMNIYAVQITGTPGTDIYFVQTFAGDFQVFLDIDPRLSASALPTYTYPIGQVATLRFDAGSGDDRLSVLSRLPLTPAFTGSGNDILQLDVGSFTFASDLATTTSELTLVLGPAASATFAGTQHLRGLVLHSGNVSMLGGTKSVLIARALFLDGDSALDITDNCLIVRADPAGLQQVLTSIGRLLRTAYNGPRRWAGPGITSSTAAADARMGVAAVSNTRPDGTPLYNVFGGENVGTSDVLIKCTWNGDANLDGVVNADDYFQIDSGLITQKGGYYNGDFNYDGVVNADDYFLIDSAFIGQDKPLSASKPQPATLSQDVAAIKQPGKKAAEDSLLAQLFSTEPVL